ncbi:hypothetical protein Tco_0657763 [Tanacetum coccineum]
MGKRTILISCSESKNNKCKLIQDNQKKVAWYLFERLHSQLKRLQTTLKRKANRKDSERASFKLCWSDFELFTGENERQTQTTEEKIDTSNALDALDASSVIIKSNGTESQKQDTSSRSGMSGHTDHYMYEETNGRRTTELSNQLLESENRMCQIHRKKEHRKQTVRRFLFDSIKDTSSDQKPE